MSSSIIEHDGLDTAVPLSAEEETDPGIQSAETAASPLTTTEAVAKFICICLSYCMFHFSYTWLLGVILQSFVLFDVLRDLTLRSHDRHLAVLWVWFVVVASERAVMVVFLAAVGVALSRACLFLHFLILAWFSANLYLAIVAAQELPLLIFSAAAVLPLKLFLVILGSPPGDMFGESEYRKKLEENRDEEANEEAVRLQTLAVRQNIARCAAAKGLDVAVPVDGLPDVLPTRRRRFLSQFSSPETLSSGVSEL